MKEFKNIIRATKVASAPVEKKFDYTAGPAISENPNADTPYIKWHPECNLLSVRPTTFETLGNKRASLYEIVNFVKKAKERGDMSITVLTTNAAGMFPNAIHIEQKETKKLRIKSSFFCTPRDVDERTCSKVIAIIEAMGATDKDFYEVHKEWSKRFKALSNDGKTHVNSELMLNAELETIV